MNRINALNAIPILSEIDKDNDTFIVHELEDVGSFIKIGIDMGFEQAKKSVHLLGFRHGHDSEYFSETTWNWDSFFFMELIRGYWVWGFYDAWEGRGPKWDRIQDH